MRERAHGSVNDQAIKVELRGRIASAVRQVGIDQIQRAVTCSRQTLNRVLRGRHSPPSELVVALASTFGFSGEWLLLGTGPRMKVHLVEWALYEATAQELNAVVGEWLGRLEAQVQSAEAEMDALDKASLEILLQALKQNLPPAQGDAGSSSQS